VGYVPKLQVMEFSKAKIQSPANNAAKTKKAG
jgi:hypothetical protein